MCVHVIVYKNLELQLQQDTWREWLFVKWHICKYIMVITCTLEAIRFRNSVGLRCGEGTAWEKMQGIMGTTIGKVVLAGPLCVSEREREREREREGERERGLFPS